MNISKQITNLLCFIGEVRFGCVFQAIQFAVQNFKAEKAHFRTCYLLHIAASVHTDTVMIRCMPIRQMVGMPVGQWCCMTIGLGMITRLIIHSLFLCTTTVRSHLKMTEKICSRSFLFFQLSPLFAFLCVREAITVSRAKKI